MSSYGADDQIEPIQRDHRQHQLIMVKLESKYIEHCACMHQGTYMLHVEKRKKNLTGESKEERYGE